MMRKVENDEKDSSDCIAELKKSDDDRGKRVVECQFGKWNEKDRHEVD